MNKKNVIIAAMLILILLPAGVAVGAEETFSGEVSLTGVIREGKDSSAKFNEYRDVRDGVYGGVDLQYTGPKSFLSFEAKDMGYTTQRYRLEGGRWDFFRVDLNYEEIPHNFTYDARTLYSGVGTNNLTYGPGTIPNRNPDGWGTFDYSVKRKNLGGNLKFDLFNPFYVDVSVNQQRKSGVYPLGVAGTSPGGMAIELPTYLDYQTDSFQVEAGYSTKPVTLALRYLYSRFDNGDGIQNFRNPATANIAAATDTLYLPPENDFKKLDFQGTVKLPFQSKLSMDLSSSRAESSTRLANVYTSDVTAAASNIGVQGLRGISLSSPYFNGKVNTDNYNFVLTSNPVKFFNAKVFYKYYDKANASDRITLTDGTTVQTNQLFDYRKNTYGMEFGFKLPASLRLTTAYTFTKTERSREDLPKNRDNLIDVGLKWTGLSFMALKVGYERLDRAAEFNIESQNPVVSLEPWLRRYDAAAFTRDTFKASVEVFPWDSFSFNVGFKNKATNYSQTTLGLTDTNANEVTFDAEWQVNRRLRFFGYFDFEQRILNQFQRNNVSDPANPPTAAAYNWTSSQHENTFGYGLGSDIVIVPDKLTLKLAHNSIKSDGTVNYSYLVQPIPVAGRTQDNIDLTARDNYRLNNYVAKATYQMTKAVALSAAYAFEEFTYEDSQYSGYQYYIPLTQGGYLTGAYNNLSYRTHVVFLSVGLKF